jgi:tRNA(Arg) A34 adenosine deaminase TadA
VIPAHAEILAIRRFGQATGGVGFEDSTLYASCEPCLMCAAAIVFAGIPRVVIGLEREVAAEYGFLGIGEPAIARTLLAASTKVEVGDFGELATRPFETWTTRGRGSCKGLVT